MFSERVGSTNSIELFTNGATAKKSLPKNLKNAAKLELDVPTVAFNGQGATSPVEARLSIKCLDPPDCFRIIHFSEISLSC